MNLNGNAPREFLAGWLYIHHVMREYSPEGGARILGSDYLGRVQIRRLEQTLGRTSEDGARAKSNKSKLIPLIFLSEVIKNGQIASPTDVLSVSKYYPRKSVLDRRRDRNT